MNNTSSLGKIHHNIYGHIKKKALSYEGEVSSELIQYRLDHSRFTNRKFVKSTIHDLINSIKQSNIVYLGDFHTFDQSSRNMQRILKTLTKSNHHVALAMEFIPQNQIKTVKRFLNQHISEDEFLETINYAETWRFPWTQYKVFFDLARQYHLQVIPLNSEGSLKARDIEASKAITKFLKKNTGTTLLVLFGEYHIVPDKLPLQVSIRFGTKIKQTIIHQNLDHIFWKLQDENISMHQILEFHPDEFILQTSPPWIKYESMCYYYESLLDDPNYDMHEKLIESKERQLSDGSNETFYDFSQKISSTLGIELNKEQLYNFNIYDYTNLQHIINKINSINNKTIRNFYLKLIQRSKSFKVPFANDYYCPSYSINRLAYLSGIHVLHQYYQTTSPEYEQALSTHKQIKKFHFFLNRHLMSFFSSKVINPFRKCDYYLDIKRKLESSSIEEQKKIYLKLSLDIMDNYNNINNYLKGHSIKILSSSAKLIGYLMAEYLFKEIISNKNKNKNKKLIFLRSLILNNQNPEESCIKIISSILEGIDYTNHQKRVF